MGNEKTKHFRPSWDEYFMQIAQVVATRATCDRRHVGAVIVRDRTILSTGYNGSIRGLPHCDEVGHLMEDGHCVRTVHAEANAVAMVTPAEGPSLGIAPAGTWMWASMAPSRSAGMSNSSA